MKRPWIKACDVREYSNLEDVKSRSDTQMEIDIHRAESHIMAYVDHDFSEEKYTAGIPKDVRIADIILSEYYAHNSASNGTAKKSESFDDYSYTSEDSFIEIKTLGLDALLKPYRNLKASGNTTMRLRKL